MMIQSQTLSLKNALFREIPYVYPLILHFKFICCHKWIHTEEMIWTCLMKSFDVSRHMPSIITWITQRCRYCQESNLYSCSQNTISWIFSSQHYIQCPLQMDLLLLFLFLMSKPFWLHFLIVRISTQNLYAVTQHLLTRRNFIFLNSPRGFRRSLEERSHN